MSFRVDGFNANVFFPQNDKVNKGKQPQLKHTVEFPKYEPPKRELTPAQQQYEDAKKKMVEIEVKYQPNRDPKLAIHHMKPFDPEQITDPKDKKEYLEAKKLTDKVADAMKKKVEIEIKYQPNRDPKLMIHHMKPFDPSQCSPEDKKAYEQALATIDKYIPKPEPGMTPYLDCKQ